METILSIAGKPGLYKLVSRGKMNLIVEAARKPPSTTRRCPARSSAHISRKCCPSLTRIVFTTVTSRNCCSGTIFWSTTAILTSRLHWLQRRLRAQRKTKSRRLRPLSNSSISNDILSHDCAIVTAWVLWHICCNLQCR